MAITFLQQQNKLSSLLGDPNTTTDDQWPVADRKFEINQGELQFARDSKVLLGYTTGTVSSQAITVPSDWVETFTLVVNDDVFSNDREISLAQYERYVDSGDDLFYYWVDSSGTRKFNFINSNNDNETYKLWYFRKPTTDLVGDTDESVFPNEYRLASVYYAASELLEQVGKTELSNRYRAKYQFFVDKAMQESERLYINQQRAIPDIIPTPIEPETDVQGKFPNLGIHR